MIFSDPSLWLGLVTLVLLEIVLGIDNLIFIAILVKKLPAALQDKARVIGLSLALVMRLILLSVMSWLVTLTEPLLSIGEWHPSGRDLILIAGGLFLIVKATIELHDRLEGDHGQDGQSSPQSTFAAVITQILLVDAVFSLDSIITAVGMVDELGVMFAAVIIAMGVMLLASKPLTDLVNRHPTLVALCLGFLLMIGFSLLAEGCGWHIPKGYLYVAIGFSILVELYNQLVRKNKKSSHAEPETASSLPLPPTLNANDFNLVQNLSQIATAPVRQWMTGRNDLVWLNTNDHRDFQLKKMADHPHAYYPVCSGDIDRVLGIVKHSDLESYLNNGDSIAELARKQHPLTVKKNQPVIHVLSQFKTSQQTVALITDEFGNVQGMVAKEELQQKLLENL